MRRRKKQSKADEVYFDLIVIEVYFETIFTQKAECEVSISLSSSSIRTLTLVFKSLNIMKAQTVISYIQFGQIFHKIKIFDITNNARHR